MKISTLLLIPVTLLIAACSEQGPEVIDPAVTQRTEAVLFAVDQGNGSDLLRYDERSASVINENEFEDANGAPLGRRIDGLYEAFDTLYLHHRASGTISAVSVKNRRLIKELSGLPLGNGRQGLTGMAFSNRSDGWIISYGTPKLYPLDAYYLTLLSPIDLPGQPTAIGTSGLKVFVGLEMADGTGAIAILSSNIREVEQLLPLPTPPIYITGTFAGTQAVVLTSGAAGADSASPLDDVKPRLYIVGTAAPVAVLFEQELSFSPSLHDRIGSQPVWAARVRDELFYLALPEQVILVDAGGLNLQEWVPGHYDVIGADYWTRLLYVTTGGSTTVQRVTPEQELLPELTLPHPVEAIQFVNSNRLR